MKLATYLENEKLTDAAFARLIGVERQAVGRYKLGERFPEKPILLKIYEATGGQVTANDFAGIPSASEQAGAPA
ncbi:MAG: XRE family transcriptional regulator [Rhodospirillaceae bacterium]|nr:MAG: XRE family transcriptional regulator [Rhodospirillaceae bacterium]